MRLRFISGHLYLVMWPMDCRLIICIHATSDPFERRIFTSNFRKSTLRYLSSYHPSTCHMDDFLTIQLTYGIGFPL